jgi:hypothetical protein
MGLRNALAPGGGACLLVALHLQRTRQNLLPLQLNRKLPESLPSRLSTLNALLQTRGGRRGGPRVPLRRAPRWRPWEVAATLQAPVPTGVSAQTADIESSPTLELEAPFLAGVWPQPSVAPDEALLAALLPPT